MRERRVERRSKGVRVGRKTSAGFFDRLLNTNSWSWEYGHAVLSPWSPRVGLMFKVAYLVM